MIKEKIENTLPSGYKLPTPLTHICTFLEEYGYPISGCFELSEIGMDDMLFWFRSNPKAVEELMPFGRGACGDVYSLWLTKGLAPEDAPVVIFGSESELSVLAINSMEFCKLLCLGYSEVGLEDHSNPGEDFEETEPFRKYMLNIYDFTLPENGVSIIKQAREQFPDFKSWVEKHDE